MADAPQSTNDPQADPVFRRAFRVLAMVGELHKRGYQLLRISPGMAPSGMHWRCSIFAAHPAVHPHDTSVAGHDEASIARYSTGMENNYFGWTDAQTATARELATLFVDRFPTIADRGNGEDWPYAGWYVQMLGVAERGHLPIAYDDGYEDLSTLPFLRTTGMTGSGSPPVTVPLPPPVQPGV